MTTEEKARAYDEALEDMMVIYPNLKGDAKLAVEHAFPELAESEDERTRKALIETVKCIYDGDTMFLSEQQRDRYLDWLEKQKEQKPVDYEAELKKCKDNPLYFYDKYVSIKQKPAEWSEEDRLHYANVLEALEYVKGCKSDYDKIEAVKSDIAWFKSLRPSWKPSEVCYGPKGDPDPAGVWKPSEEQMKALLNAEGFLRAGLQHDSAKTIAELYEQLKKL